MLRFEDIWAAIAENFSEPDEIKPVYIEYYSKLLSLPSRAAKVS